MQSTTEYSSQQSQLPSCQNGLRLNPSSSIHSEQSQILSGNSLFRVGQLPQSTVTQFLSIRGQYALVDSDISISGISLYETFPSKKVSKSSKSLEKDPSFLAKILFQVHENVLAAFEECFDHKQSHENTKLYHLAFLYTLATAFPEDFRAWVKGDIPLDCSPTAGNEASSKNADAFFSESWYDVLLLLFVFFGEDFFLPFAISYSSG